jgi:hypothetical protein
MLLRFRMANVGLLRDERELSFVVLLGDGVPRSFRTGIQ